MAVSLNNLPCQPTVRVNTAGIHCTLASVLFCWSQTVSEMCTASLAISDKASPF